MALVISTHYLNSWTQKCRQLRNVTRKVAWHRLTVTAAKYGTIWDLQERVFPMHKCINLTLPSFICQTVIMEWSRCRVQWLRWSGADGSRVWTSLKPPKRILFIYGEEESSHSLEKVRWEEWQRLKAPTPDMISYSLKKISPNFQTNVIMQVSSSNLISKQFGNSLVSLYGCMNNVIQVLN